MYRIPKLFVGNKTGGQTEIKKILVAYFSASGVTAKVSKKLADAIGADLHEIQPSQSYTNEDLNWRDKNSRSSVEMNDRSCRPAIENNVADMEQYDTVFVGFPIWWYREPSIIDTFMEAYNFDGKTVIPFATSGGSGMGDSAKYIQELAKGAHVVPGKRFAAGASSDELVSWAKEVMGNDR